MDGLYRIFFCICVCLHFSLPIVVFILHWVYLVSLFKQALLQAQIWKPIFQLFLRSGGRSEISMVPGFAGFCSIRSKKWRGASFVPMLSAPQSQDVGFTMWLWGQEVRQSHVCEHKWNYAKVYGYEPEQIQIPRFKTTNENIYTECNVWFLTRRKPAATGAHREVSSRAKYVLP